MYDGMKVYRAVVSYSAGSSTYVKIPSLFGESLSVPVSTNVGLIQVSVGDQVVVAVEDDKLSNIYVLNTSSSSSMDGGSA